MTTFTNNKTMLKTRGVAVLTGGVLAASALFHPVPAQADAKKEKTYKAGAAVLGVLGAYFILKGKTVPGVIAGAGAYYAYKKGKEAQNDDRYSNDRYSNDRYSNDRYSNDRYDTNGNANDYYAKGNYPNDDYSNNNYSNGNDTYPDGNWSTPASNSSRDNGSRYPDYAGIAPSQNTPQNTQSGTVVLK